MSRCQELSESPVGTAMVASVAVVIRGLLVTTAAVATVAYLLLTNSHI
jgi:hypothetical protein